MKVNNIILGKLIKNSVTLFNYSLLLKDRGLLPKFSLNSN